LQYSNQSNVDNLSNVQREASRHFRNKKKENLKAKIDELETNSNTKNIRDLYRVSIILRRVTSPELIQYVMRSVIGFAVSHGTLTSWRNHFFQLLNVQAVIDFRQTQTHTAETPVPEPSTLGLVAF
jgi:hypothetical protein